MDQFASPRNRLVDATLRSGRTLSINWPLWQAGGMRVDAANLELLMPTGMRPLQTATGMQAFRRALALPYDQVLVVEGDAAQMRRVLAAGRPVAPEPAPRAAAGSDSDKLLEKTRDYLREQFSSLLKLPAQKIDPYAALEKYGIDSILAMRLTNHLEKTFGSLSKTLFFEYQTIDALAGYFVTAHAAILCDAVGLSAEEPPRHPERGEGSRASISPAPTRRTRARHVGPRGSDRKEIAIVGLAGRYPQAQTLQDFWRNLRDGPDRITELP